MHSESKEKSTLGEDALKSHMIMLKGGGGEELDEKQLGNKALLA